MTRGTQARHRRTAPARWLFEGIAVACVAFACSACPASGGSSEAEEEEVIERVEGREVRLPRAPNYQKVRPASPRRASFRSRQAEDPCARKGVGGRPFYYCPGGRTANADTVFLGQARKSRQ